MQNSKGVKSNGGSAPRPRGRNAVVNVSYAFDPDGTQIELVMEVKPSAVPVRSGLRPFLPEGLQFRDALEVLRAACGPLEMDEGRQIDEPTLEPRQVPHL